MIFRCQLLLLKLPKRKLRLKKDITRSNCQINFLNNGFILLCMFTRLTKFTTLTGLAISGLMVMNGNFAVIGIKCNGRFATFKKVI